MQPRYSHYKKETISADSLNAIRIGAANRSPISGLTHCFYRYPARFSPAFVASAIETLSQHGNVILDPYMGGGTTIIEAMARGRVAIGCDLNSLAVFVTSAKTTLLTEPEVLCVRRWAAEIVPLLSYHTVTEEVAELVCPQRTRNLNLPRARPVKKLIAQALLTLTDLPSDQVRNFARCILLNVAQWALNNRKVAPSLQQVRGRIVSATEDMLSGLNSLSKIMANLGKQHGAPKLIHATAENLPRHTPFTTGTKVDLVITSPPYPGIHILYHRWQVDGRKETPAPYWIADCFDGKGSSYYNFADRKQDAEDDYFTESLRTLKAVRSVMKDDALMIQMIAFSKPRSQLLKYLRNMELAGFQEVRETEHENRVTRFRRVWRAVPGRAWYANLKGQTTSSREVVLIHRAV